MSKSSKPKRISPLQRLALLISSVTILVVLALCTAGDFYVHHPEKWLAAHRNPFTRVLEHFGDPAAFFTDALGWTGRDAVNTPDDPPPEGEITFAGDPVRTGAPAPSDIVTLDRGEFRIGWSPSLRHPVWAAYHVPRKAAFDAGKFKRPSFRQDRSVLTAPKPSDYEVRTASGASDPAALRYDRGHLVPNHAIVTRFGPEAQRKTFLMSNIAPQTVGLNQGLWREFERYIADLWTAKYGEIWVVVGTIPAKPPRTFKPAKSDAIDVPEKYYMVIASQTEDSVRVLAVLFDQTVNRGSHPRRHIVSVDELERLTGLDFFPNMQKSLQTALEADVPTRLWPIRAIDILNLILVRLS